LVNFSGQLGDKDRISLELDAYAASDYRRLRSALIARLLPLLPETNAIELIASHLIRYPDAELSRAFLRTAIDRIGPVSPDDYSLLMTLFCVAAANEQAEILRELTALIRRSTAARFDTLEAVQRYFLNEAEGPIGSILPIINPSGLDVVYAMFDRFEPAALSRDPAAPPAPENPVTRSSHHAPKTHRSRTPRAHVARSADRARSVRPLAAVSFRIHAHTAKSLTTGARQQMSYNPRWCCSKIADSIAS
jgi:hypothetical protein